MPYFNRFDVCEAYYVYALHYHRGQGSKEYAVFGRLANIGFDPSRLLYGEENLSENGREIYNRLVSGEARVRA
jgi:hypothetical protein